MTLIRTLFSDGVWAVPNVQAPLSFSFGNSCSKCASEVTVTVRKWSLTRDSFFRFLVGDLDIEDAVQLP